MPKVRLYALCYLAIPLLLGCLVFRYAMIITVDDIFIMLWSGKAFLDYGWFVNYNFKFQEMSSSVLATLAAAAAYAWAPAFPMLMAKIMGVCASVGALWVYLASGRLFFSKQIFMPLAVLLTLCSPTFYYWSAGFLEQPYYCLLLAAYLCSLIKLYKGYSRVAHASLYIALALLMLIRPESPWILVFHIAILVFLPLNGKSERAGWHALFIAIATYAALLGWRWFNYGYLLPNPSYAKTSFFSTPSETIATGLNSFRFYYLRYGLLGWLHLGVLFYVVAIWCAYLFKRVRKRSADIDTSHLITAGLLVSFMTVIMLMGGNWMLYNRFMMPAVILHNIVMIGILEQKITLSKRITTLTVCIAVIVAAMEIGIPAPNYRLHGPGTKYEPFVPKEFSFDQSLSELNATLEYNQLHFRSPHVMGFLEQELPEWVEKKGILTILLLQAGAFPSQLRMRYPEYDHRITFIDSYGLIEHNVANHPVDKSIYGNKSGLRLLNMAKNPSYGLGEKLFSYNPNMIFIDHTIIDRNRREWEQLGYTLVWDKLDAIFLVKNDEAR